MSSDSETEDGQLHADHLEGLFLVAVLDAGAKLPGEGLADDGNEQVEKDDDVEDAAEEEDHPVTLTEELQVPIELTQSVQERLLPRFQVGLPVFLVVRGVRTCSSRFNVALQLENFVNWKEGVGEGKDANDQDAHEHQHVAKTGNDHAHEPTEKWEYTQLDQESAPDEQGTPCLDGPEVGVAVVFIEDVEE